MVETKAVIDAAAATVDISPRVDINNNNNNNNNTIVYNKLYTSFHLIILDSYVILQPDYDVKDPHSIFIDRTTLKIELRPLDKSHFTGTVRSSTRVYGCLGIINLLSGPHLICILEKSIVGCIRPNQIIHKVTKTIITPIARVPIALTDDEKKEEKNYLSILTELLESFDFYYSYDFDVTHSEQRASDMDNNAERASLPLWRRADRRFFWNYHMMQIFIDNGFDQFILPMMDGFIRIIDCDINSNKFKYIFISRRSCKRTGARYHMRGADPNGNVANFVETEQIVVFDEVLTSFVQTRGSIPLIWQQKGKEMKPKPIVDNNVNSDEAFQNHLNELLLLYGPQVIVSLIDQTGGEMAIGDRFETYSHLFYSNQRVKYVAFDFHEKCKNNKYENLAELLNKVKSQLDTFGYLFKSTNSSPTLVQTGSFRTNCIDCLDRTNVVQSLFARYILHSQLTRMGIISASEKIESHAAFESQFKHIWADNADVMSEQYTGTVALKTDYTRFGKRSVKGTMTDGVNSVRRYLNKNYKDDDKQLAIDLILGKYLVEKWDPFSHTEDNLLLADDTSSEGGVAPLLDYDIIVIPDGDLTKVGIPCFLHVSSDSFLLVSKVSGRRKEYPFHSITLLEKSRLHHRQLNIYSQDSPSPECIQFTTSLLREQFLQILYRKDLPKCYHPTIFQPSNPKKDLQDEVKEILIDQIIQQEGAENVSAISPPLPTDSHSPPPPPPPRMRKLYGDLDCFIGSWNMENITINSTILAEWIPKGRELYAISAQRIASDRPSPGFVMNYKQYWFYLIRQYLGLDYICVATGVSTNTASIVLIKKSLANTVSNIVVTHLNKRSAFRRPTSQSSSTSPQGNTPNITSSGITTSFSPNPTPPPRVSKSHEEETASTSGKSSSFSLGSKLIKFLDSGSKTTSDYMFKDKYKDVQYGTCISFYVKETSMCFLNYCNNNITGTMDSPTNDDAAIIFLKNKQYINGSNRYVFWAGDFDYSTLKVSGWNEFVPLTSDNEIAGRGVIYWRSLPLANSLSLSPENKISPTTSTGCLFPPISSITSIPTLIPYTWLSTLEVPCFIVVKNLMVDQFELLSPNSKIDAHLEFNSYHLLIDDSTIVNASATSVTRGDSAAAAAAQAKDPNNVNSIQLEGSINSIRSTTVRGGVPAIGWNDVIELKSFIDDKHYLKTQFIQVALFDKDVLVNDSLIGKGNIPLSEACGHSPYHFKINLTAQDEKSCVLQGDIQVFSKSEIAKMVEMAAANVQPPPVPTRPSKQALNNQRSPETPSPSNKSPLLSFIPPIFPTSSFSPSKSPSPNLGSADQESDNNTGTSVPKVLAKMVDNLKVSGDFFTNPFKSNGGASGEQPTPSPSPSPSLQSSRPPSLQNSLDKNNIEPKDDLDDIDQHDTEKIDDDDDEVDNIQFKDE